MTRDEARQARGWIRDVYARDGGQAGCCLHVVVDDGNTGDASIAICVAEAERRRHALCMAVAQFLGRLSRAQRRAFLRVRR